MTRRPAPRLPRPTGSNRRSTTLGRRVAGAACVSTVVLLAVGSAGSPAIAAPPALRAPLESASIAGLSEGARGSEVRALQQALIEAGVTVRGGADGVFGPATRAAVLEFQGARGLSATGEVDAATADSLATATGSATAPSSQGGWQGYVGLGPGASGAAVKQVQQRLMDLGVFVAGGADGAYGAATERAVTQFQRWNGLEVTGTITEATARTAGFGSGSATPSPPTPEPQNSNAYVGLARGASGQLVRDLQRALISAGVTVPGGADGAFGPATETALKGFQRSKGHTETGRVGAADAAALGIGAAPPPAPDTAANPYVGLQVGARGALVKDVQQALIAAGINVRGGADGVFGNATKGGLVLFQRDRGLGTSGAVDVATAKALGLEGSGPVGVSNPAPDTPTPPSSSNPYVGLTVGDEGPLVKEVQLALQGFGFVIRGGANGVFGPSTKSTLMAFQSVNGIPRTGVVTEKGAAIMKLGSGEQSQGGGGASPLTIELERFPVQGQCFFGDTWHAPRANGRVHEGVDIIAPEGKLLYAMVDGEITKLYWDQPGALAGNGLRLTHADGTYFTYLHMLDFAPGIDVGTKVEAGDVIGFVGNTGSSATAHLHLEIHPRGGAAINPYQHVKAIDDCRNTTPQYQQSFPSPANAPVDASNAEIGMST